MILKMILVQLKKKFVWKIIFFLSMGLLLFSRQEFKRIEQWQHDRLMPGHLFDAVVDQDGDLIAAFQKAGVKIANKNKIVDFGPLGQGPNDLDGFFTLCFYKGDLSVEGMAGKLKIFHKKDGKYSWKQTIRKQAGALYHPVKDGKFMAGKWFFSGPDSHRIGKNKVRTYYLRVYNEKGKYIWETGGGACKRANFKGTFSNPQSSFFSYFYINSAGSQICIQVFPGD